MPRKQSMSAADSWRRGDLALGIKRRFTSAASSDRMRDPRAIRVSSGCDDARSRVVFGPSLVSVS
jgi:hypothetical protein